MRYIFKMPNFPTANGREGKPGETYMALKIPVDERRILILEMGLLDIASLYCYLKATVKDCPMLEAFCEKFTASGYAEAE